MSVVNNKANIFDSGRLKVKLGVNSTSDITFKPNITQEKCLEDIHELYSWTRKDFSAGICSVRPSARVYLYGNQFISDMLSDCADLKDKVPDIDLGRHDFNVALSYFSIQAAEPVSSPVNLTSLIMYLQNMWRYQHSILFTFPAESMNMTLPTYTSFKSIFLVTDYVECVQIDFKRINNKYENWYIRVSQEATSVKLHGSVIKCCLIDVCYCDEESTNTCYRIILADDNSLRVRVNSAICSLCYNRNEEYLTCYSADSTDEVKSDSCLLTSQAHNICACCLSSFNVYSAVGIVNYICNRFVDRVKHRNGDVGEHLPHIYATSASDGMVLNDVPLEEYATKYGRSYAHKLGGHHASPRMHERREHLRHLKSGKVVKVHRTVVNRGMGVGTSYAVKASENKE